MENRGSLIDDSRPEAETDAHAPQNRKGSRTRLPQDFEDALDGGAKAIQPFARQALQMRIDLQLAAAPDQRRDDAGQPDRGLAIAGKREERRHQLISLST